MKTLKLFFLAAMLLPLALVGCSKEDPTPEGTLKVILPKGDFPLSCLIYPMEIDPQYAISIEMTTMEKYISLNVGNYIITTGDLKSGLQIRPNKTTVVTIDQESIISYENGYPLQ